MITKGLSHKDSPLFLYPALNMSIPGYLVIQFNRLKSNHKPVNAQRTPVVFGLCDFWFCTNNQVLILATNDFALTVAEFNG